MSWRLRCKLSFLPIFECNDVYAWGCFLYMFAYLSSLVFGYDENGVVISLHDPLPIVAGFGLGDSLNWRHLCLPGTLFQGSPMVLGHHFGFRY